MSSRQGDDPRIQDLDDAIGQFIADGDLTAALNFIEEIEQRADDSSTHLWVASERAKVWALKGEVAKAEECLARANELIVAGVQASPRLTAGLLNSRGLTLMGRRSFQEADTFFQQAEHHAVRFGWDWLRAAILINRACAAIANTDFDRALRLLDEADSASAKSEVKKEWKTARSIAIETNRASALLARQDINDGIAALLRARQGAAGLGDKLLVARQDHNLAGLYSRQGMHKSALDAAIASYDGFLHVAAYEESKRAGVSVVKELTELGQYQSANRVAERLRGGRAWDSIELGDEEWLRDLQFYYILTCRHTGRTELADHVELIRMAALGAAASYETIIDFFISTLGNAFNALLENRRFEVPKPIVDREYAQNLPDYPLSPAVCELLDMYRDLLLNGTWDVDRINPHRAAILKHGIDVGPLIDSGLQFVAEARKDSAANLHLNLRALYRYQMAISNFETSEVRSHAHLSITDSEITLAFANISLTQNWSTQFEVIEFLRRDSAKRQDTDPDASLKPYVNIADRGVSAAGRSYVAELLPPEAPYRVRGKSAIAEAAAVPAGDVDADEIRQVMGGRNAAWLNSFYWQGALYWSVLDEDGVFGGRAELDEQWHDAWEAHRRLLPLATAADARCLGESSPEWCVDLLALARASKGGLINSAAQYEACLDALPARYQAAAQRYTSESAELDIWAIYAKLAERVIPARLRSRLSDSTGEFRLLLSPTVELATLPFILLPTGDNGRSLVEQATCQIVPPNFLATTIAGRAVFPGLYDLDLFVSNPTSDLRSTPATDLTAVQGACPASDRPFTRSRLLDLLGQLDSTSAQEQIFAYIGHIRPGSFRLPGSAALVLAGESATEQCSYLSASDLLRSSTAAHARVYLGGCEGAGFDTGVEWGSVASALIARGASAVIAHAWPVLDDQNAQLIDRECVTALSKPGAKGLSHLRESQAAWLNAWRRGEISSLSPYYWSGIQCIGRF